MSESEIIEFEEEETEVEENAENEESEEMAKKKKKKKEKYPYPYEEEIQKLTARIDNLEGVLNEILALLKKKPETSTEEEKKELSNPVAEAIESLKEQLENLSKKVETLSNAPVRVTQTTEAKVDPNEAVKRFREQLTAADAIIYAETHGIKYGDSTGE